MKRFVPAFAAFTLLSCAPSHEPDVSTESVAAPLTAAQCLLAQENGKVTVCHATHSAKNPFVVVRVSAAGCVDGHAGHPKDFVAAGDPTCQGLACVPSGDPCDESLGCCDGLTCSEGVCSSSSGCVPAGGYCDSAGACCAGLVCHPAESACGP